MKYRLPSLNALRAVETVGRHGSISGAATELHVSPGAISRHITLLEGYFGCKLFTRHAKGLSLTEVGRTYVDKLSEAFSLIDDASAEILRDGERKRLVIRALGAFSTEWLLPRIAQFELEHPEFDVTLRAQLSGVDFDTDDADVGIIGSFHEPSGVEFEALYTPYLTPIVTPEIVKRSLCIENVEDLKRFRLLHATHLRPTWEEWLTRVAPEARVDASEGYWLERSTQVHHAVHQGAGVGLGEFFLVADELISGSLIAPLNTLVQSPHTVYIVWPKLRTPKPEVEWFRDWLTAEVERTQNRLNRELPEFERITITD